MKKEQTKVVRYDIVTTQKIAFMAKGQGLTPNAFLLKLIDNVFQLAITHDVNPFNLTYEFSLFPTPQLQIRSEGASSFRIGQVDEKELEAERKQRFDEVKLDIAEAREKQIKMTENKNP